MRYVPRSVRRCGTWQRALTTWRQDGEGEPETGPFRCGSWRCPSCRPAVAFQDYARIAAGIASRDRWVYLVLTLPSEARQAPLWERFAAARSAWRGSFRRRVERRWGRFRYVQTWEAHRDGTPHVNLCLAGPAADRMLEEGRRGRVLRARGDLVAAAVAAGFGPVLWCEPAWTPRPGAERPLEGLASYLVKCWAALGGSGPLRAKGKLAAELARAEAKAGDQTPVDAPRRFRRFSASPGLLPPRRRGEKVTGTVHRFDGRPWGWAEVRRHEALRERRAVQLLELASDLERRGLPVPEWTRTVRPHHGGRRANENRQEEAPEGPLPGLRSTDREKRHAEAPAGQARRVP